MQVNSVHQSPNFGMALQIKNTGKAVANLKSQSMEYIDRLNKVAEQLKDTKYYHMELQENLAPKLVSSQLAHFEPGMNAGTDIILNANAPESLQVGKNYVFRTWGGWAPPGTTRAEYNVQRYGRPLNDKNDIEAVAEVAIKLDKNAISHDSLVSSLDAKIAAVKSAQQAEREKVSKAVDDLMSKFSVNA